MQLAFSLESVCLKDFKKKMLHKLFLLAIISSALFIAVSCDTCNGTDSAISAPEVSLSELDSGCSSSSRSRETSCVSAVGQFCSKVDFPDPITTLGVSVEAPRGRIQVACVESEDVQNVPIEDLRAFDGGCNARRSQNRECLSAIRRYCADRFGESFSGFSQGVGEDNTLEVHCFESSRVEVVRTDVMRSFNGLCHYLTSHSDHCFSAASRFCQEYFQSDGGIPHDSNINTITVACYRANFSREAFVVRDNDFYASLIEVETVCDFEYDLDNSFILEESPELLKSDLFDNSNSSVPLSASFSLSRSVTETSTFTTSTAIGFTFMSQFMVGLPLVAQGTITIGTSLMTTFGTTNTNTQVTTYMQSTSLTVPPGKVIRKIASVTISTVDVPFTATVRTALGSMRTIEGVFQGTSANNFRVTQEELTPGKK